MDLCGPCVAIMIGCMRVGCFWGGCCGGWKMCIGDVRFNWPTQAMESVGDFAILFGLAQASEEEKYAGKLYPLFLVSYGIMRFFLEFLRDTAKDWLYLSHGQWFSLVAILIGLIWLRRSHKTKC